MTALNLKRARELAGAVSDRNSKMPGSTYAISALHCQTGGKLARVDGSTCSRCYAIKLQKMRPSVHMGWTSNLHKATEAIAQDAEGWIHAMVYQINRAADKSGERYHRWFDAGDLQSTDMLRAIIEVARRTPDIQHWLPTREATIVRDTLAHADDFGLPPNLVIRVSSTMVGDAPRSQYDHTSTVRRKSDTVHGHACPARNQGNACGDCRACWDRTVPNVSYPLH